MDNFRDVEDAPHDHVAAKTQLITDLSENGVNSLKEPIKATLKRDVETIYTKLKFFFNFNAPINSHMEHEIRNYDLWGPFVFFLMFAVTSSLHQRSVEGVFTVVIMVLTFGSFILTVNSKLLNVNLSILQGVSLIGYSMFPMNIASLFTCIFYFLPAMLKAAVAIFCAFCSIRCGHRVVDCIAQKDKVYLVGFPLVIFYLSLCWIIIAS